MQISFYQLIPCPCPRQAAPETWEEWMELRHSLMNDSSANLCGMQAIPLLEKAFKQLLASGVRFDQPFIERMNRLFAFYDRYRQKATRKIPRPTPAPRNIGANLEQWNRRHAALAGKYYSPRNSNVFTRLLEPQDRVRRTGGRITVIAGIPYTKESDEKRLEQIRD